MQQYVAVVGATGKPLMPTTNRKANKLIGRGRAVRRFDRGIFYIQLTDREDGYTQPIAMGIDPGSVKEGFSIKSAAHTYLNFQADAVTWVKESIAVRAEMRGGRRYRHTPYRKARPNRHINQGLPPPSTHARWDWKLRLCQFMAHYFPISVFVVEDIAAKSRPHQPIWNRLFSPLEVGKQWFYTQLSQIAPVETYKGYETKAERDQLGLKKSKAKTSDRWEAHCIDAWVLANAVVGGHTAPDNMNMLYFIPLRFHRRQLHRFQPEKHGKRKPYGGTRSLAFKRGSWVKHPKYGLTYVGGATERMISRNRKEWRISLHSLETGQRLTQYASPDDLILYCTSSWRVRKERKD